MTTRQVVLNEPRQRTLQEARMGFGMHSAVALVEKVAGAMRLAAPDPGAGDDKASEKVGDSHLVCRETSTTWGDAPLLTSVRLATE